MPPGGFRYDPGASAGGLIEITPEEEAAILAAQSVSPAPAPAPTPAGPPPQPEYVATDTNAGSAPPPPPDPAAAPGPPPQPAYAATDANGGSAPPPAITPASGYNWDGPQPVPRPEPGVRVIDQQATALPTFSGAGPGVPLPGVTPGATPARSRFYDEQRQLSPTIEQPIGAARGPRRLFPEDPQINRVTRPITRQPLDARTITPPDPQGQPTWIGASSQDQEADPPPLVTQLLSGKGRGPNVAQIGPLRIGPDQNPNYPVSPDSETFVPVDTSDPRYFFRPPAGGGVAMVTPSTVGQENRYVGADGVATPIGSQGFGRNPNAAANVSRDRDLAARRSARGNENLQQDQQLEAIKDVPGNLVRGAIWNQQQANERAKTERLRDREADNQVAWENTQQMMLSDGSLSPGRDIRFLESNTTNLPPMLIKNPDGTRYVTATEPLPTLDRADRRMEDDPTSPLGNLPKEKTFIGPYGLYDPKAPEKGAQFVYNGSTFYVQGKGQGNQILDENGRTVFYYDDTGKIVNTSGMVMPFNLNEVLVPADLTQNVSPAQGDPNRPATTAPPLSLDNDPTRGPQLTMPTETTSPLPASPKGRDEVARDARGRVILPAGSRSNGEGGFILPTGTTVVGDYVLPENAQAADTPVMTSSTTSSAQQGPSWWDSTVGFWGDRLGDAGGFLNEKTGGQWDQGVQAVADAAGSLLDPSAYVDPVRRDLQGIQRAIQGGDGGDGPPEITTGTDSPTAQIARDFLASMGVNGMGRAGFIDESPPPAAAPPDPNGTVAGALNSAWRAGGINYQGDIAPIRSDLIPDAPELPTGRPNPDKDTDVNWDRTMVWQPSTSGKPGDGVWVIDRRGAQAASASRNTGGAIAPPEIDGRQVPRSLPRDPDAAAAEAPPEVKDPVPVDGIASGDGATGGNTKSGGGSSRGRSSSGGGSSRSSRGSSSGGGSSRGGGGSSGGGGRTSTFRSSDGRTWTYDYSFDTWTRDDGRMVLGMRSRRMGRKGRRGRRGMDMPMPTPMNSVFANPIFDQYRTLAGDWMPQVTTDGMVGGMPVSSPGFANVPDGTTRQRAGRRNKE